MGGGREGYARPPGGSDMHPPVQTRGMWENAKPNLIPTYSQFEKKTNKNSILTAEPNRKSYPEKPEEPSPMN